MLRRSSLHCITLSACSIHQNVQFCIFRYQLVCSLCILLPAISSLWGEERYVILYVPVFRGFPYPAKLQCTENCSVGILAVCQVAAVRFIAVIKDVMLYNAVCTILQLIGMLCLSQCLPLFQCVLPLCLLSYCACMSSEAFLYSAFMLNAPAL